MVLRLFAVTAVHAAPSTQPQFIATPPTQQWGGQVVSEGVPYQPSVLFTGPVAPTTQGKQFSPPLDSSLRVATLTPNAVLNADEFTKATEPQVPPGARNGIFQKLFFTGTWLPQLDGDNLGWGDLETGIVFGFPFFRRDTPLLITPQFGVHFLDAPVGADLPDRVYDSSFEFRHLRKFGGGPWAMDVAVTLGYYSDFEQGNGDAFRVTGRGLVVYETTPGTKWVFGVGYYNRAGVSVLPIGGVIHQPSPDVKWEFIFPRPRIAWRLPGGIPGSGDERWFYVGGEFGSGLWSIERPSTKAQDIIIYSDYRVLAGYERNIVGGLSCRYEFGYVFARNFEFDSATPDIEPDDTLLFRVGLTY